MRARLAGRDVGHERAAERLRVRLRAERAGEWKERDGAQAEGQVREPSLETTKHRSPSLASA